MAWPNGSIFILGRLQCILNYPQLQGVSSIHGVDTHIAQSARRYSKARSPIKSGTPTLVVAGALHFSGPRSVIALLQRRGYKIDQL
jgi:TraB/PrgY/gumN family